MKILKFTGRVLLVTILLLVAIYIVARNVSNAYMKEDYLTEINDSFEPIAR